MPDDLIARIRARADDPRTRTDNAAMALPPQFPMLSASGLADSERRLGFRLPAFLAEAVLAFFAGSFSSTSPMIR